MAQHTSRRSCNVSRRNLRSGASWTKNSLTMIALVTIIAVSLRATLCQAAAGERVIVKNIPISYIIAIDLCATLYQAVGGSGSRVRVNKHSIAFMTDDGQLILRDNTERLLIPFKDNITGQDCWEVYECLHEKCPGEPKIEVDELNVNGGDYAIYTIYQESRYLFPFIQEELRKMRDEQRGPWNPNPPVPDEHGNFPPEYEDEMMMLSTQTAMPVCPACVKAKLIDARWAMQMGELLIKRYQTLEQKKEIQRIIAEFAKRQKRKR